MTSLEAVREFLDQLRKWADNTATSAEHDDVVRSAAWWRAHNRLSAAVAEDELALRESPGNPLTEDRPIVHPAGNVVGFRNELQEGRLKLSRAVFGTLEQPIRSGDYLATVRLAPRVVTEVLVLDLDFTNAGLVSALEVCPDNIVTRDEGKSE